MVITVAQLQGDHQPVKQHSIVWQPLSTFHPLKSSTLMRSQKSSHMTGTGIPSAGPGGNPFHNTTWLAREETDYRPSQSHPSSPRLRHLPDLENALNSHMHVKHKLGYADRNTGYK
eukprot:1156794-Pelagomonas_calceolata.AAC.5